MNNTKVPNRKFWTFFPCDRILKHNLHVYSYPVNNEEKNETKRRCCFSDNVAVCAMLSFSVFGESVFRPKHSKSWTELPKREGGGKLVVVRVSFVAWLSFSVFGGSVKIEN